MLKISMTILIIVLVVLAVAGFVFRQQIGRGFYQRSLFSGAEQHHHFVRQSQYFPIATLLASDEPHIFPAAPFIELPADFLYGGEQILTEAFLVETDTAALLVLRDGELIYENYWLTGGRDVKWLAHSVSKSFVSAAVGLVLRDGLISTIEDPISDYVPALKGSGYDGVRIKDVLQMSSGIRWTEAYADPQSDINRFGWTMFMGHSYNEFVASMVRENEPGAFNRYTGMDTQALAMLVTAVTEKSLAAYLEENLWHPMGMESDAYWTTDNEGTALALGGFNAIARDYAKFGELHRRQGEWNGVQILPADWVRASVTPDAPHLVPGEKDLSSHSMGYGYQWWLLEGGRGDYSAIGIYNQFIYVNPEHSMVIVKLSANRRYAQDSSSSSYRETETFELFREIAVRLQE